MIPELQQLLDAGWTLHKIARAIHAPITTLANWKQGQRPEQYRRHQLRALYTGEPTHYVLEPVASYWRVIGLYATQREAEQHSTGKLVDYVCLTPTVVQVDGAPWFVGERLCDAEIERHGGTFVDDRRAA